MRLVSSKIFSNTKWGFALPANISWFQKRLVDVLDVIIVGFVFRKEKKLLHLRYLEDVPKTCLEEISKKYLKKNPRRIYALGSFRNINIT